MIQASSRPPVDPESRAISAETMKMPEPIIEPTTMVVESNRPRPRTKPEDCASAGSAVALSPLASDTGGTFVFSASIALLLIGQGATPGFEPPAAKAGPRRPANVTAE